MAGNTSTAEKIIANLKGLRNHLLPDEQPIMTFPGIWDGGQQQHSTPCEIVLTDQRLLGYYFVSFPRERLFLEALTLSQITNVSLRQKSFEPLFRELMISEGERKVYIRAPRKKIELLYSGLREAIDLYAPSAQATFETGPADQSSQTAPVYGRQDIQRPFESSPLAILLLFVGGLVLEIAGVLIWMATRSSQTGLPLCVAGFLAVFTALMVRRQQFKR
ncbi:MAG TPA: hypothetical protein VFB60_13600 [Ktedonobacteraceae bacterium]|nr:hypothetical protein [Ktedonobacteraceae bacterium]